MHSRFNPPFLATASIKLLKSLDFQAQRQPKIGNVIPRLWTCRRDLRTAGGGVLVTFLAEKMGFAAFDLAFGRVGEISEVGDFRVPLF
jgi:hypothetical protein